MSGFTELWHDDIAGVGLEDPLGFGDVVAGAQDEPPWIGANVLVGAEGELDQLSAPQPGALAAKPARRVLLPGPAPARMPSSLTSRNRTSFAATRC